MLRLPPDPEKSALAVLKEAEAAAEEAQQDLDAKRQEVKAAKAVVKAAAANLTEAKERLMTRWVLLVGEAILNATERQLQDSKGKQQQWFNLLNPVLDAGIKPDDRTLYDDWKRRMQMLGAPENGSTATGDTDADEDAKKDPGTKPGGDAKSDTDADAGSDTKASSVSSDPQASSGEDPSTSSDAKALLKPSIGWKPVRLDDKSWGSRLTGKAVADLPEDLDGAPIVVTASKGETWEARIKEVVSRDEKTVIVRDSGKPESRDDGPQAA